MGSIRVLGMIIGFALLGFLIYRTIKQERQLTSDGKIICRSRRFMEQAEDIILVCNDRNLICEKIKALSYSEMKVAMTADGQQAFHFSFSHPRGNWGASLCQREAPEGKVAYRFQFTHWKVSDFGVIGEVQMNMLLTAVEKMFLSIDPDTQVKTQLLETQTSHKFF